MHPLRAFQPGRAALLCALFVCAFFFQTSILKAQGNFTNTDAGTEFLLVFMANESSGYDPSSTRYQDIYLISAGDTATVTLTCKAFPGFKKIISLAANGSSTYRISTDPVIGYPAHDAIIESSEVVDPTVFKVVSTSPIICYGHNNKNLTGDAFLALPKSIATTDYLVMSYGNSSQLPGLEMPSEFCVASFDDEDTVTITPTGVTRSGRPAGQLLKFVLNSGEAVQIQTDPLTSNLDLTGSRIVSSKSTVVYGGHARTEVPSGFRFNQSVSRNHIAEQIPPLQLWGKLFIAKNTGRTDGDVVRIVSGTDNTVIKINGNVWGKPLRISEFRDTLIPFSAIAVDNTIAIETSSPTLVGLIGHSAPDAGEIGDAFLAMISPLERSFNDFRYFIPTDPNFLADEQFVVIVTEISGVGKISKDGVTIPALAFTEIPTPLGGKHYAITTLNQSRGVFDIVSENLPELGMTVLVYGFGSANAYGYTAGGFSRPAKNTVTKSVSNFPVLENFPNPAIANTTIRFNMPNAAFASVKIYDALGRVVRVVSQSVMSEGEHSLNVNTFGLAAGSYTIELLAPEIGVSEHSSMIVME